MAWAIRFFLIWPILHLLGQSICYAYPTPIDIDGKLHVWSLSIDDHFVYYDVVSPATDDSAGYSDLIGQVINKWNSVDKSLLKLVPADDIHPAQITITFDTGAGTAGVSAGYAFFDDVSADGPRHCGAFIGVPAGIQTGGIHKTTLHEIGHCLGLAHSLIPSSIMSYKLDENEFALSIDDEAALARLYPLDASGPQLAAGCVVGHQIQRTSNPSAGLFALVVLGPGIALAVCGLRRRILKPLAVPASTRIENRLKQ